jgi:hypothetical protein
VTEAYGGVMCKLPGFLRDGSVESYTHLRARAGGNLDVPPRGARLTLHNARDKAAAARGAGEPAAAEDLKEYSCLCGLVAVGPAAAPHLQEIRAALAAAAAAVEPTYT